MNTTSFDVVVVGAGITGLTAAFWLSRAGLKVVLVQDRPVLGGNTSSGTCRSSSAS